MDLFVLRIRESCSTLGLGRLRDGYHGAAGVEVDGLGPVEAGDATAFDRYECLGLLSVS